MEKMCQFGRSIALALACVGVCARAAWADVQENDERDAKAFQALAAPRAAQAKPEDVKGEPPDAVQPLAAQWQLVIQNDALAQQFRAAFYPVLSAELAFIRGICDVPEESRARIRAAGEAGLKLAARRYAAFQNQDQSASSIPDDAPSPPYPPKIIHEALAAALKETLPPDNFARYADESVKRTESRKRAAVLWVVSRLDGMLFLTTEQRDQITASITSQWQDHWEQWLSAEYDDQYFPAIPRRVVAPHLRQEQKMVWRRLEKVVFCFDGDRWAAADAGDGYWGDEPQQAAGQAAAVGFISTDELFAAPDEGAP